MAAYDDMERNELLGEASRGGISNPHQMSDEELREALREASAPQDDSGEVSEHTDWDPPVSPTSGVPTPMQQPGRMGAAEAPAPQDHLVTKVQSVKGGLKGTLTSAEDREAREQ